MEMTIVNVLVPTYKPNASHLQEALDSLIAQSENNWHCHICNEPTDIDTVEIVKFYLNDSRFTYHQNEKCLGIGGNWNRCISYADAPVVAFLFQDDRWAPDYLEKGLNVLHENESVGFVSLDHEYFYEGEMKTAHAYEELRQFKQRNISAGLHSGHELLRYWIEKELHPNIIGEPPFVMFRKETLKKVGSFHEDMPQFLDVEYWLRCLQVTDWYFLKENLGGFRVHSAAASARNEESGEGVYDRLKCFEQLINSLPKTPVAETRPSTTLRLNESPLRGVAIAARNRALEKMMRKYLDRRKEGKSVCAKGGFMKRFALKHPILVGSALARALSKRAP